MNTKVISSGLLVLALFTPLGVWAAGENNTEESCLATFSVSDQILTIPCVEVVMGNETVLYSAQLQQVEEGSFALTQVAELSAAVESECVASYSLETGELGVPCVEEVNPPALPEITGIQLYADNPVEPSSFTTNASAISASETVRSSSRPMQTATGMYYPADTNSTGGFRGWLSVAKIGTWRGCHLGIDYKKSADSPVYAVWDGEVVDGGMSVKGYGSNGGVGGAIIVKHLTSNNQPFYAVYGHITNLKIAVGQRVTIGQHIANVVNLFDRGQGYIPHLHFGINTRSPSFKGYTANCQNTFGFVNPQKFIETTTALQSALLKLDSTITVTPNPIIQGQSVTITAKISNREGTKDFVGTIYAAFHRLGDDTVSLFDIPLKNQPLGKGQDYTYTFGAGALNLVPGTYHLYIKGDDARALPVTATGLRNPIQVKVVKATTTGVLPTIAEISPLEATVNQPTNFIVKGSNLTTGMGFAIEHCEGTSAETTDSKTRNSATERTFTCTPRLLGKWLVTVKDKPSGLALTVPAAFQTVTVINAEVGSEADSLNLSPGDDAKGLWLSGSTTPATSCNFSDVGQTEWYAGYVMALCSAGIVVGYPGSGAPLYKPNNNATMVEGLKVLNFASAYDATVDVCQSTTSEPNWYQCHLDIANSKAVWSSLLDSSMKDQTMLRGDAFLYASKVFFGISFNNVDDAVMLLTNNGVINVEHKPDYNPRSSDPITRAELAAVAARAAKATNQKWPYGLVPHPSLLSQYSGLPESSVSPSISNPGASDYAQQIVERAKQELGKNGAPWVRGKQTYCGVFVRTMFDKPASGHAYQVCDRFENKGKLRTSGEPATGSVICYSKDSPGTDGYGHISIATGTGTEIGVTSVAKGVMEKTVESVGIFTGWITAEDFRDFY